MSSFGYVIGGARTIVDGLMELCENGGTILACHKQLIIANQVIGNIQCLHQHFTKKFVEAIPAHDTKTSDVHYMGISC